jgi:hypothetical protein
MSNSVASQAKNTANQTGQLGSNLTSGANGISSTVVPELQQQSKNPTGIAPTDLNAMKTSAAESAGGATAAADSQAKLRAARTGNTAGISTALDENARNRARVMSDANLKIAGENAQVKQTQQSNAERELGQLYGTDVSGANKAYDTQNESIKLESTPPAWLTDFTDISNTLSNAGKAASGMGWTPFGSGGGSH